MVTGLELVVALGAAKHREVNALVQADEDVVSINGPSYRLKNRLAAIERDTNVA